MGQGHKLLGPTIAPQNPAVRSLGWERRILVTPSPYYGSFNSIFLLMLVSLHLPRGHTGLQDIPVNLFTMCPRRLIIRNVSLMTLFTRLLKFDGLLTMWGSGTGTLSFIDFLGNLDGLNTFRSTLHIRRKARGYFSYTETLLILLKSETLSFLQSLLYPLVTP